MACVITSYSIHYTKLYEIQLGVCIAILGAVGLAVPLPQFYTALAFYLFGLGLAPMFPAMMHETPIRFGRVHSQRNNFV